MSVSLRGQFTWTGAVSGDASDARNWLGGVAPTGNGTENFVFPNASTGSITFADGFEFNNISVTTNSTGFFAGTSGTHHLVLNGNVTSTPSSGGYFVFGGNSTTDILTLSGTNTFNIQNSIIYVFGRLDGNGAIVKTGSQPLVVLSKDNTSTYTGNIDLQTGHILVAGDGSLGTGTITFNGGAVAVSDYDADKIVVLNNNLIFGSNVTFDSPDTPYSLLEFAGSAIIQPAVGSLNLVVAANTRLTIDDGIGETDPNTGITKTGQGTLYLLGPNTFSGTLVANGGYTILAQDYNLSGSGMSVGASGYLGTMNPTNIQAHFIDFISPTSQGIIGFDSPSSTPHQAFNENIDLTGFDPSVRIGTATSAELHGLITPQGLTYRFGGPGVLYDFDDLTDDSGMTRNVTVSDGLQFYMESNGLFTGILTATTGGAAIFDGANSPAGAATSVAAHGGYIGTTQNTSDSTSNFLGHFDTSATHGVVGFDSMPSTIGDPYPVNMVSDPIDFTNFASDAMIGSSTPAQSDGSPSVILTGLITPSGTTYNFTGFRNGLLGVQTLLSDVDISTSRSVVLGQDPSDYVAPVDPTITYNPAVLLKFANTYTGGTLLRSGELIVGNNSALGTGTLTVGLFGSVPTGLAASDDDITISNAIAFGSSADQFKFEGGKRLIISGDISGGQQTDRMVYTASATLTLSGNNAGLLAGFTIDQGEIDFTSDHAAGAGEIDVINSQELGGTIKFTSAAPQMGTLRGDDQGVVNIATSGNLTINQGSSETYDGQITGTGGLTMAGLYELKLTNANTDYAGVTNVQSGTLRFTAAMSHLTHDFNIGTLSGSGASMFISDGGSIDANTVQIGTTSGAIGGLDVIDSGSEFSSVGTLKVGANGGAGYFVVIGGATATTDVAEIGFNTHLNPGGRVELSGAGSVWTVNTSLTLGNLSGDAVFFLFNQGTLNLAGGTGTIELAVDSGSTGDFLIGNSTPAGFIHAAALHGGAGNAYVEFTTTNTASSPYYLTQDSTSGGTPVLLTGSIAVVQHAGVNVLVGNNTYSGGTTIAGGTLVAGSNNAFGSGAVTLNGGSLSVANGVTLSNPLNFVSTAVISGNGTIGSHINVGTGITLSPGNSPGNLTFSSGLTWSPGGEYDWQLQTNAGGAGTSTGWDLITVTGGPLDMTSLTSSSFTLKLISLDGSGNPGSVSDFNASAPFSWTIATASSGITGFNPANITIDASNFANYTDETHFSLSVASSTDLILTFTPVPEPSTYALLGLGALGLLLAHRRRNANK